MHLVLEVEGDGGAHCGGDEDGVLLKEEEVVVTLTPLLSFFSRTSTLHLGLRHKGDCGGHGGGGEEGGGGRGA